MAKSIIQWNCRGLRPNFTDFRLLCDKYNPIVCCLQETFLCTLGVDPPSVKTSELDVCVLF